MAFNWDGVTITGEGPEKLVIASDDLRFDYTSTDGEMRSYRSDIGTHASVGGVSVTLLNKFRRLIDSRDILVRISPEYGPIQIEDILIWHTDVIRHDYVLIGDYEFIVSHYGEIVLAPDNLIPFMSWDLSTSPIPLSVSVKVERLEVLDKKVYFDPKVRSGPTLIKPFELGGNILWDVPESRRFLPLSEGLKALIGHDKSEILRGRRGCENA